VVKINDKMLMLFAAVVTGALCIGGMYMLLGGEDQRYDLNIALDPDAHDMDMSSLFEEFGSNTTTNVNQFREDTLHLDMLASEYGMIFTFTDLAAAGTPEGVVKEIVDVTGGSLFIFYNDGNETARVFLNWIALQLS